MSDLLDLNLYVEMGDFLDERTAAGIIGGGEAAFEWAHDHGLRDDDLDYFMLGNARLAGQSERRGLGGASAPAGPRQARVDVPSRLG
jgi:hypothetical protein